MCRRVSVELPGKARSASDARRFVARHCDGWGLHPICDDVALPVSELVTNAVLHARTPVTVTVSLTAEFLEVSVRDSSPRPPVVRPVRTDLLRDIAVVIAHGDALPSDLRHPSLHVGGAGAITAGRGLQIVDAVADEWGVAELAGGKETWFRIRTPQHWRPEATCPCPDATTTTPGGRPFREQAAPPPG